MDKKNIEQLLERYFNAETTLAEEQTLRTYFQDASQLPADLAQWRGLFCDEYSEETLDDSFDARMLNIIAEETTAAPAVKARRVTLSERLAPLYKAAAVVAIIVTLGGALQAPWDSSWTDAEDYATLQRQMDTICVTPVQAENVGTTRTDSAAIIMQAHPQD